MALEGENEVLAVTMGEIGEWEGDLLKLGTELFGQPAAKFIPLLSAAPNELSGYEYEFLPVSEFRALLESDGSAAMRVYWLEILYRAHFAAATSLIRSSRWMHATMHQATRANAAGFLACFRGFLEAAADSHDALESVATNLAECHTVIRKALIGELENMVLAGFLEDALIHFTHARKVPKNEDVPSTHRAKHAVAYIDVLDNIDGTGAIRDCYALCCEMTHPASFSVMTYAERTPDGTRYRITDAADPQLIRTFCARFHIQMPQIMVLGLLPPVLILATLNEFDVETLRTDVIRHVDLTQSDIWAEIQRRLGNAAPPRTEGLKHGD